MKPRRNIQAAAVDQELLPGQSKLLLQELHLLTRQGDLNADARRKLKQINHLVNLLKPAIDDVFSRFDDPVIVDVGSGKSYLGFLLYDLFFNRRQGANGQASNRPEAEGKDCRLTIDDCRLKDIRRQGSSAVQSKIENRKSTIPPSVFGLKSASGRIIGIEQRPELVTLARRLAGKLGFERMEFQQALAESAVLPPRVHMLVALHACDTATDDALLLGLKAKAQYIAVVPCCQAEVAAQLKELRHRGTETQRKMTIADCRLPIEQQDMGPDVVQSKIENRKSTMPPLGELYWHGIHRREFGSHLTNVIRALTLEAAGYQVTVTELVGWEHSLKNELIMGRRVGGAFLNRGRQAKGDAGASRPFYKQTCARDRLLSLLEQFPVQPKLLRQLGWFTGGPSIEIG